jgi:hypothetical protein
MENNKKNAQRYIQQHGRILFNTSDYNYSDVVSFMVGYAKELEKNTTLSEQIFESEWNKRRKMHFAWEYIEDAGCINKTDCRRMIKHILKNNRKNEQNGKI